MSTKAKGDPELLHKGGCVSELWDEQHQQQVMKRARVSERVTGVACLRPGADDQEEIKQRAAAVRRKASNVEGETSPRKESP